MKAGGSLEPDSTATHHSVTPTRPRAPASYPLTAHPSRVRPTVAPHLVAVGVSGNRQDVFVPAPLLHRHLLATDERYPQHAKRAETTVRGARQHPRRKARAWERRSASTHSAAPGGRGVRPGGCPVGRQRVHGRVGKARRAFGLIHLSRSSSFERLHAGQRHNSSAQDAQARREVAQCA